MDHIEPTYDGGFPIGAVAIMSDLVADVEWPQWAATRLRITVRVQLTRAQRYSMVDQTIALDALRMAS
jgi:hypothetical protein